MLEKWLHHTERQVHCLCVCIYACGGVRMWRYICDKCECYHPYPTANPLGIAVAFLASPHFVKHSGDVFTLSWVYLIPAGVGVVLAVLTFWRNRPPTPPSLAAEHKQDSFFRGVKAVCDCLCAYVSECVCLCVCVFVYSPSPLSLLCPY